jgi:hypothetical protein
MNNTGYKGIPVKLFFTRLTKRAKWRLIVTTNTSLSFNDTYKIYQIRWTIEVFLYPVLFIKNGKTVINKRI